MNYLGEIWLVTCEQALFIKLDSNNIQIEAGDDR